MKNTPKSESSAALSAQRRESKSCAQLHLHFKKTAAVTFPAEFTAQGDAGKAPLSLSSQPENEMPRNYIGKHTNIFIGSLNKPTDQVTAMKNKG